MASPDISTSIQSKAYTRHDCSIACSTTKFSMHAYIDNGIRRHSYLKKTYSHTMIVEPRRGKLSSWSPLLPLDVLAYINNFPPLLWWHMRHESFHIYTREFVVSFNAVGYVGTHDNLPPLLSWQMRYEWSCTFAMTLSCARNDKLISVIW